MEKDYMRQVDWNLGENLKSPISMMVDGFVKMMRQGIDGEVQACLKNAVMFPLVVQHKVMKNRVSPDPAVAEVEAVHIFVLSNGKKSAVRIYPIWMDNMPDSTEIVRDLYEEVGYSINRMMEVIGGVHSMPTADEVSKAITGDKQEAGS